MSKETFEFSEGSSNKFWTIELEGSSFTVVFGKIGAAGQTQTKNFASDEEARNAYNKLVAEKIKKGYVRTGGSTVTDNTQAVSTGTKRADNVVQLRPRQTRRDDEQENASGNVEEPPAKRRSAVEVADKAKENLASPQQEAGRPTADNNFHATKFALRPDDYIWCHWKPRAVSARKPVPVPFDRNACIKRLSEMTCDGYTWVGVVRKKYPSPLQLSREEAEFWFRAWEEFARSPGGEVSWYREKSPVCKKAQEQIVEHLKSARINGIVTSTEMDLLGQQIFQKSTTTDNAPEHFNHLLCALLSPQDLVQYASSQMEYRAFDLMQRFRESIMPHLQEPELDSLRQLVRANLKPNEWLSCSPKSGIRSRYVVAAFLGMGEEIQKLVETIPDGTFHKFGRNEVPHILIFSLPTSEAILSHGKRLKLNLSESPYISISKSSSCEEHFMRYWMAGTGVEGLSYLLDVVRSGYSKDYQERYFKVLALADAPEMTPLAIELLRDSLVPHQARFWLEAHPWWSVPELLKLCSEKGKVADTAKDILSMLRHNLASAGLSDELVAQVNSMFHSPEDSLPVMDEANMPQWLKDAFTEHKPSPEKLPPWLVASAVPAIMINKQKLNAQCMELVLFALKKSTFEVVHPLIEKLRNGLESRSSDRCVWWLFDKWLKSGAPPKDKWALLAIGFLGSDDTAIKLTPLIRQWPGESQHQRAVVGLECLRQIGSDTALMQINGIAQKLQFKGLKQKAAECMEYIAQERGLSREELEDRIVPDCGLDERGQRVFDFGPRKFSFVLSPEMKALVKDEEGKIKPDLPKPNAKDDATKAEAAVLDWKLLKQQVKDVAKVQAFRLEQAMVTGRRWIATDFQNLLVKHPLMFNLIRLVVWGEFDMEGMLRRSFRVTEDQTLADQDDKLLVLEGQEDIGMVHPLQLDDELKTKWGEVFSDYDLISPFPQLARPIYTLDESEKSKDEITRFAGKMIPAASIVSILERLGWQRGDVGDGGCFSEHYKYFPGADVTAVADYEWIGIGMIVESDDQDIQSCHFHQGKTTRGFYYQNSKIPLEFVDSIVLSEVLSDLTLLASKARADQ